MWIRSQWKKSKKLLIFLFCLATVHPGLLNASYKGTLCVFNSGRFGDQLITYLHAKWYAYENQIPFLYTPFLYSSELALSFYEKPLDDCEFAPDEIYFCPYFPESKWDLERNSYFHFPVDWENKDFRSIVKAMVAPLHDLSLISPPKNRINVALHFREGGGYDLPIAFQVCSWKFPPLSFYIECLIKTVRYFENKPVYCYVFTDALNPEEIIEQIQDALPQDAQVVVEYRRKELGPNNNVLEDFFSLFNFDVLIRPESNFSIVPSRIHDYAIIYSPKHITIEYDVVQVDQIYEEINEKVFNEINARVVNDG